MTTSSSEPKTDWNKLYNVCFAPVETIIFSRWYWRLLSLLNLLIMASFSSGVPSTCVYLVWPLLMASMAAFLICSGVSKSGSPALKLITSIPLALNSIALAEIVNVADGLTFWTLLDSIVINHYILQIRI